MARTAIDAMLACAEATAPEECCGLLLGEGDRVAETRSAHNVADDPLRRFEIDPAALIAAERGAREGGPAVLGYYHSHPDGRAVPSPTDRESAARDGRLWAIVAGRQVRCYRAPWSGDGADAFSPVDVVIE